MRKNSMKMAFLAGIMAILVPVAAAFADDVPEQHLSIKNHAFVPQELTIPAGQKIKLIVKNEDDTASEFESFELNREKVVPAHGEVPVFIGPLDAGTYPFFDDFHRDMTRGRIIAK